MKILMITPEIEGGLTQYSHGLCEALTAQRAEVVFLTSKNNTEIDYFHPRFKVVKELQPKQIQSWWNRRSDFKDDFKTIRNLVLNLKPEIVHFQSLIHPQRAQEILSWLASQGVHTCHTAHNLLPHESKKWHRETYRSLYTQCQGIITHTQDSAVELNGLFGIRNERIAQIPHGNFFNVVQINPQMTPIEAKTSLGLDPDSFCLLFFGPLKANRGIDILLRALAYLKKYPRIKLLIAGERGKWDLLEDIIDMLKIRSQISLYLDYIPVRYVGQYFQAADTVVLPYRQAYSGSSILMAYSFGRPVIASNLSGPAEIMTEGENGFLPMAGEAIELAKAIQKMYHLEESEISAMGNKNLALAQNKHNWKDISEQTLIAYRRWLSLGL